MSDSDSTQSWNEEEENGLPSSEAFNDALASLEEHLQEHDDTVLYDEEQQPAEMYEEGVEFTSEIDAEGDPVDASYIDQAENSDLFEAHQAEQDDVAEPVAIDDELDSIDAELEIEDEADIEEMAADDFEEDLTEDLVEEEIVDEDLSEEASDDADNYEIANYTEMDSQDEAEHSDSTAHALIGGNGNDGTDDFNLATLTQLVDEIRQESQRVAEMKTSVSEALSLIQEMSESLKS